jgi:hypothetical protein
VTPPFLTGTPVLATATTTSVSTVLVLSPSPSATVPGTVLVSSPTPVTPTTTPCALTFSDVPSDNPFYAYIRCLACRGILNGYADGTFRPYNLVTRGQTCKLVSNAAGWSDAIPSGQQTFSDVPPTHPFWLFIERAYAHGVISGYTDGTFHPDALVTRGQLAKIDTLAAGWSDPIPSTQQTFEDIAQAYPFWLFIERAALHGVIAGYTCGGAGEPCNPPGSRPYYRPANSATRAQTAKIVASTFFSTCQTP